MEKPTNKIVFRILVLFFILVIGGVYYSFDCIYLRLTPLPDSVLDNVKNSGFSLFVLTKNICVTCPIGAYLADHAGKSLVIVPAGFTDVDIDNLRYAFALKGRIIREDAKMKAYFERMVSCLAKSKGKNWYIEITNKNKIGSIKTF